MLFYFFVSVLLLGCGSEGLETQESSGRESVRRELQVQVFFPETLQKHPGKMQSFLAQSQGLRVSLSTSKLLLCEQWTSFSSSVPIVLKGCLDRWDPSQAVTLKASLYGPNRAYAIASGKTRVSPDTIERNETVVLKLTLKVPLASLK